MEKYTAESFLDEPAIEQDKPVLYTAESFLDEPAIEQDKPVLYTAESFLDEPVPKQDEPIPEQDKPVLYTAESFLDEPTIEPIQEEKQKKDEIDFEKAKASYIESNKHVFDEHAKLKKKKDKIRAEMRAGKSDKTFKKDIKPILNRMVELTQLKEDMKEQLYGGGLEEPWLDPTVAFVGGGAPGAMGKVAMKTGQKLLNKIVRQTLIRGGKALSGGLPAVPAEYVIGHAAEIASENNPELAFILSLSVGLASGFTVENLIQKKLLSTAKTIINKYPKNATAVKLGKQIEAVVVPKKVDEVPAKKVPVQKKTVEEIKELEAKGKVEARVKKLKEDRYKSFEKEELLKKIKKEVPTASREEINEAVQKFTREPTLTKKFEDVKKDIDKSTLIERAKKIAEQRKQEGFVKEPGATIVGARKGGTQFGVMKKEVDEIIPELNSAIKLKVKNYVSKTPIERKKLLKKQYLETTIDENKAVDDFFAGGLRKEEPDIIPKKDGKKPEKKKFFTKRIAAKWDKKVDSGVAFVNRMTHAILKNDRIRDFMGVSIDTKTGWKEIMRNYKHDIVIARNKALDLGNELKKIAPTKLEQRNLMRIIRGGVTKNKEMAAKAKEVQKIHKKMNDLTKEFELSAYSRFDELTRKERSDLLHTIHGKDPYTIDNIKELKTYAKKLGVKDDLIDIAVAKEDLIGLSKLAENSLKFHKKRLDDYYHFGSAKEYGPILREQFEKPTKEMRKALKQKIKDYQREYNRAPLEVKKEMEPMIDNLRIQENIYYGKKELGVKGIDYEDLNKLDLSYTHQRKDMPVELQKALSKIDEAPYPIAKNLLTQGVDIHTAKMYKDIADNSEWAVSKLTMENRTKDMVSDPKKRYVLIKVNEDKRFGALEGMYVRRDVWNDLKDTQEIRNSFIKALDTVTGWWKFGKVILSPATQTRNLITNHILMWLGDVKPGDKAYRAATKAMFNRKTDEYYKEAYNWGLYNDTFFSADMNVLRSDLESLKSADMMGWVHKALKLPAKAYEANEHFGKTAIFIKNRMAGKSIDDSAKAAEKFLFNYADIPPVVKHMKRWVHPFFTFTYKSVPLVAEMAIRRPHKVAMIGGAMYGMEQYAMSKLGMTEEQAAIERKILPEWQQTKVLKIPGLYNYVLMPWGSYLNFEYILPLNVATTATGFKSSVVPSHPLFTLASAFSTGTDPYTKKPYYNENADTLMEVFGKFFYLALKQISPGLTPGNKDFKVFKDALLNKFTDRSIKDYSGEEVSLVTDALLGSLLGIKLTKVNTDVLLRFAASRFKKMVKDFDNKKFVLGMRLESGQITEKQYEKKLDRIIKYREKELSDFPDVSKMKHRK